MHPGERVEHYVILEQIGQGGQATVWSAVDEQLKRTVAIKTIDLMAPVAASGSATGTISAEDQSARFISEAKTIADLEHPYILPIYSFGQQGNLLYIIMRYMAGGTLRKLITREPIDLPRLIKLAEPIADALDMAHLRRIVHRDIKSVNILLDAQERPYLSDFGLSVTIGDPSQHSGSGTLAYMAPEQLRAEFVDHRADIYAFGVLLYEMLTGDVPMVGTQHWNLTQVISRTPMPIPGSIPDAVANVLRRTTSYNPMDRYASATEIIEDLKAAQREMGGVGVPLDSGDGILTLLPVTDPAMQASIEASRLFETALDRWADGAGRFRMYEEDFKFVDSFYNVSDELGMHLDEAARRLMLRGALEFGYNLDHWWSKVDDIGDRRIVALQTLTSDLHTARMRAMEHLDSLEDSTPPAIPIRVAMVIEKEPESSVRLAGVRVLDKRTPAAPTGITGWREVGYNAQIDGVLAKLAAEDPDPVVALAAAEAIGHMCAVGAIRKVATHAETSQSGSSATAFQSLMVIRAEVGALPSGVPGNLRRRVFTALTIRQLFAPGLLARFVAAALGFAFGWAIIQFFQYGDRELLFAQAVGNSIATGALYGVLAGFAVLFAAEPSARLRAWSVPGRAILGLVLGGLLSIVTFTVLRLYYYFNPEPLEDTTLALWHLVPSVIFITGFVVGGALTRRWWLRALLGGLGVLAAVYGAYLGYQSGQTYDQIIFLDDFANPQQPLILAIILAALMGILTFAPEWIRALRRAGGGAGARHLSATRQGR